MKYKLKDNVILKGDNNLFLVYDAEKGNIVEVNEIAFDILKFCKRSKGIKEILQKIKKDYEDVPKEAQLQKDIKDVINYFVKKNILKNG